jgi:hypothetical protein
MLQKLPQQSDKASDGPVLIRQTVETLFYKYPQHVRNVVQTGIRASSVRRQVENRESGKGFLVRQ